MKDLDTAISPNIAAAKRIRKDVDQQVWHRVRNAVHKQVAAELVTRAADVR